MVLRCDTCSTGLKLSSSLLLLSIEPRGRKNKATQYLSARWKPIKQQRNSLWRLHASALDNVQHCKAARTAT